MKGVPIRLEVGPKDISKNEVRAVRRDNRKAQQLSIDGLCATLFTLLETIQSDMFLKAKAERDSRLIRLETWEKFVPTLESKCMILAPWCENIACEDEVKKKSAEEAAAQALDDKSPSMGAKTLCIPFTQPTDNPIVPGKTKCFVCEEYAKSYTLWGRSY